MANVISCHASGRETLLEARPDSAPIKFIDLGHSLYGLRFPFHNEARYPSLDHFWHRS
jgi:hypothetical protein